MFISLFILSLLSSSLFSTINSQSVDCGPTQIQLFFGDDYYSVSQDPAIATSPSSNINTNQAYIVWHALDSSCTFAVQVYDPTTNNLVFTASANSINDFSYDFEANGDTTNTGVYHTVAYTALINKLSYEKAYQYTITDLVGGISEGPFRFTLPTPYLVQTSRKLFVAGDMDAYENGLETINSIKNLVNENPDEYGGWIMMGDAAYNVESDSGNRGDAYFQTLQSFNSRLPSTMILGNHDRYANWTFINLRIRNPLFYKTQNQYFSYNYQGIHFTSVNFDFYGNSDAQTQQAIYNWIDNDLSVANSTANRAKWPWVVFLIHRPIYCSYYEQDPTIVETSWCYDFYRQRKIWDELIHKYSVDLTIEAHKHSYERMLPIYQNKTADFTKLDDDPLSHHIIDPQASVFIMEGSGGQNYYTPAPYSPQGYSVVADYTPGYGVMYVQNNTDNLRLVYEHYSSGTGEMIDYVNIVKTRSGVTNEGGSGWTIFIAIVIILVICGLMYLYWQKKQNEEEREMRRDDSKSVPLIELKR